MKIYRVVWDGVKGNKQVGKLWNNYYSAAASSGNVRNETRRVEVAHVPEDLWSPVDKKAESRSTKLTNIWYEISHADPDEAERMLEQLAARVETARQWHRSQKEWKEKQEAAKAAKVQAELDKQKGAMQTLSPQIRAQAEELLRRLPVA